ncbi:hypothetical protein GHT06_009631 [Daphnia sinensis]|uniref:Uncharacterized protein n=1 Tax=Daphnia sinensis TaxID=1820382 RepID=A0AAD5LPH8_9CRUS|nr:hypothetical protein GHT06_009631 [Daphnia sinensis]
MVDDVTAALKSRKSKLTLKLSDGCNYDDYRSRPNSISRLKNYEKLHGSASLPQTPVSPETSAINKRIDRNTYGSDAELHFNQQSPVDQECKSSKPRVLSESFRQLKRLSEWTKLPAASSTSRWSYGRETVSSSAQHRRLLMMTSARNNLSLDSQKDSPDSQSSATHFIYPPQISRIAPSVFHQSDPGGLMNATSPNTDCATNVGETPSARLTEANSPSPTQEKSWKTNEASARVVVHRSANLNPRRQKRFHSSSHLES